VGSNFGVVVGPWRKRLQLRVVGCRSHCGRRWC
jgi:hypothetical protein